MHSLRLPGLSLIVISLFAPSLAWAATFEANGKVESVTVYRNQAMVTRMVPIDAKPGPVELVVGELPRGVQAGSVFAEGDNGVQVRAVRYRTRAVAEEPQEQARKLAEDIEKVQAELRRLAAETQVNQQLTRYVAQMETFAAARAKEDLAAGKLNAESLTAVTEMVFQRRRELMEASLEIAEKTRAAQEQLQLLQRKRQELASSFSRTVREAVVFLDKPKAGAAKVRLSYMVAGANWSPTYVLRSGADGKKVSLEYNALVSQVSGEDWSDVKLTLSTAMPSMAAEAPILAPLWVTLAAQPGQLLKQSSQQVVEGVRQFNQDLQKELLTRQQPNVRDQRPQDGKDGRWQFEQDYRANALAGNLQMLDMLRGREVARAKQAGLGDDVLAVSYPLESPITLPSRHDQQMIRIAKLNLPASFYYQAAPVLSPYVYRQADVTNDSEIALLAGPVHAYADGQFTGVGQLPLVAKGQRFTIGFGIDSQLRVGREMVQRNDRTQGGNRELTFRYRLLVDNYKNQPAQVRLLDRLPDPAGGGDIRVTVTETSQPLSDNAVYQRTLRKSGILRWGVNVPARSSGADAKSIEYEFRLEFDKNLHLTTPAARQLNVNKARFLEDLRRYRNAK